ncbi:MAG TPA: DUF885 family protein [Candidatus Aminicenantes bacterium]|nr:DUF885 family protein [Candidatus Aminicenantes bacterium]HRY66081.1 DUF885 family protein [Candidatus Aminicenantes bacterium]HRZ72870.1 DUF885 family protein [Candidatus Aminicenantes bacterium]
MKKTAAFIAVLAVLGCTTGALLAQSGEDAKFKKFQDSFWDAYFKFYPTAGTLQGYTKYNDKLEDPSEGALDKFNEILDGFNQELVTKIDRSKLSAENQIDHEMYLDFLDLEFLKLQYTLPWQDNPLLYNDLFVQSLRSVLVKNGGNAASAAARAKLIPGLVKRAKDSLKNPPQEYTQAAIDQMPAILDFYRVEVPKLSGGAAALQAEVGKAITALEDYQRWLKGDLLAKSTGNFRMPDPHLRLLRRTTQGNLPILEDVVKRSLADFNNIRRDMFLVCIPFYKIMYPHIDIEQLGRTKGEEQTRNIVIQGVLDKIKGDHVGRDEFVGRISSGAAAIRTFVQQQNLIELPADTLTVEPLPAYGQPGLWSILSHPGAFEAAGTYTLYVKPVPAEWSAEDAASFMEEHNNYYMDFMSIQNIFPGQFVPLAMTRKDPSTIRRIAANQGLLKGWPIFLEDLFMESGYGNYDLRMRLNQLKLLLKTVIDFQMDINVHEGTWTKDKVIDYMTVRGFMTKAEAERRWNKIVLNPGDGAQPYIGYQEILDMEKDYRKLKGDSFNAKEFLQKLVSHGAIPLVKLKAKIAQ